MDLSELVAILQGQAGPKDPPKPLNLNKRVFEDPAVLANLRTEFAVEDGTDFLVHGIRAADIKVANKVLLISGGTASVLGLNDVVMELRFTAPGGSIEAVITATMDDKWEFTKSFEGLGVFPFTELTISGARFIYSTMRLENFIWPGKSKSQPIALEKGLNFLSDVCLDHGSSAAMSLIKALLDALKPSGLFPLYGRFAPTKGAELPEIDLGAHISEGTFPIGHGDNKLQLRSPTVAVRIGKKDTTNALQPIDLLVQANLNGKLEFSVGIPNSGQSLAMDAAPIGDGGSIQSLLELLPGIGKDFRSFLPEKLQEIFASVGLKNFSMIVDFAARKVTYIGFSIGTEVPLPLVKGELELKDLTLEIKSMPELDWRDISIKASAELLPHLNLFNGEFDFTIDFEGEGSPLKLALISGAYFGSVNLGKIVEKLGGKAPKVLSDIWFTDFGVIVDDVSGAYTYTFFGSADGVFPISGRDLTAHIGISVVKSPPSYQIDLSGSLVVGAEEFLLNLDLSDTDSNLSAGWETTGEPLGLDDIARAFGVKMPTIPPELDLGLKSADFEYEFAKAPKGSFLGLTADAATADSGTQLAAVFAIDHQTESQQPLSAFGLETKLDINLAEIPGIGSKIPKASTIGIQDAKVWVLSRVPLTEIEVNDFNDKISRIKHNQLLLPVPADPQNTGKKGISAPVLLGIVLQLGPGNEEQLKLALGQKTGAAGEMTDALEPAVDPPGDGTAGNGNVTPPTTSPDGAKWKDINKSIGPLTIQRLGLKYADSQVYFLLDVGFSAGGLTMDLSGLAVSSPIKTFSPAFHLSGLEVEYKSSVFEIAGEFLNVPKSQLPEHTQFEYAGAATLKVGEFDLSALGSYANVSGKTSLFVFAVIEFPLGGPPFFFVTGAAAGFGYNRNLKLPEVNEVPDFPLVAAAMNPTAVFPNGSNNKNSLSQALGILEKYIPPEPGEYWLAAGVRFTSFEMLSSFALVSVAFGNRLEIALLGESQLSVPSDPNGDGTVDKIANVELALEIRIDPDSGEFQAAAVLTQNSWVLSNACRLTGGFAFYIWYGNNPHSGDFVITLGGYNPHYQPAQWYPNEPRLGIDWTVSTNLTIKGGCYFALTPHAIMAGGGLQLLFQLGGLRAWLTAYADFLIEWQPFFYEIDVGVTVGVAYTFDIFGLKFTLSLEIGATLDLHGPPFGGKATVHLWIISFTIHFGPQTKTPPALSFEQFNTALLPKDKAKQPIALTMQTAPAKPIFIKINIAAGVLESPTSNQTLKMPIVSAGALDIQVVSSWPASTLIGVNLSPPVTPRQPPDDFDYPGELHARPMQGTAPFKGTLGLQLCREGQPVSRDRLYLEPILKNAPSALWGPWNNDGPSVNTAQPTIPDVPFGIRLKAVGEKDLDPSAEIPLKNLAAPTKETIPIFWPDYVLPGAASGDGIACIQSTIDDARIAAIRENILTTLTGEKIANLPKTVVIGADIKTKAEDVFLAAPRVANLGQAPVGNVSPEPAP